MVNLDSLIKKTCEIAPFPVSTVRLAQLVSVPEYHLSDVIDIIRYDQVLTMRLLRVANSAANALVSPVTTVNEAVFRMGTAQILALAVATGVTPLFKHPTSEFRYGESTLWRHSTAAAVAAETSQAFCSVSLPHDVFTAALLHDIGKLAIGRFLEDDVLKEIFQLRSDGQMTQLEAETKVLGVHHGELGGMVARSWQLPESIIKGIVYHHNPMEGNDVVCDFVCFANQVAKQIELGLDGEENDFMRVYEDQSSMLPEVIQRIGVKPNRLESLCYVAGKKFEQISHRYNAV